MARHVDRELALSELARRLYEIMDRIDPVPIKEWEELDEEEREFYRDVIATLLHDETTLVELVLDREAQDATRRHQDR